tara:strand:+ start:479 stop:925 length:447 start_codon:yes stop_codon:yes gene_type:complete
MPYPMLNKHSEAQYLELEKNYFNLFNALQSLLTHTEGEDFDEDSKRLIHFSALCIRINQIVEEYADFTSKVQDVMFKGDSATTTPIPEPSGDVQIIEHREPKTVIVLKVNKKEYGHIIEALEHFASMYPDLKVADEFQQLSNDIKDLK